MGGIYVPGYGSSGAKIVLVGEAPGKTETETGVPFSGPAGDLLDEALRAAGIDRNDCYLTNVCKVRPPDNKLDKLHLIGRSIEEFLPQLWDEIEAINPNIVVAIGGTALKYLTGFDGIEKYRGSILRCCKTGHKVVATLHPASLLHEAKAEMTSWKELAYIKADLQRVAEESLFREIILPDRSLLIARNSLDVIRFFERNQGKTKCTLDVETFKTYPLCVGLAFSSWEALSIPTFEETIPLHDLAYIWKLMAEFVADCKVQLIAQNGKFDEKRCRQIGLTWYDLWFDIMLAWHTLYSEFPKKLHFISSVMTKEPYYKDEGREYNPKKDKIDRLFLYNAKDAAVEYECYEAIEKELIEQGLLEWFFDRIMPLHRLYSDIEDVGLLVDQEVRKQLRSKYQDMRVRKHEELISRILDGGSPDECEFGIMPKAGRQRQDVKYVKVKDFNVNSPDQVAALLYGYLKCPPRKDTGEDTLKSLANNGVKDDRRKDIIKWILEERKIAKSIGTYIEAKPSSDGRIHTQYRIDGTESGRTSTAALKPPVSVEPEGIALQTMTKHEDVALTSGGADLRAMYVADPGWSFLEPDLSQAEDRVVCVLAKDWDALKEYERKEYKYNKHGLKDDRHTKTSMQVCELSFEEITDYYRQIGKRTRHSGNYNVGKHQHMLTLAKFGNIFISEWRAGKQLEKFHEANPNIRGIFHEDIKQALIDNDCRLVSPHGRPRTFFNKWGEDLFKEAYAQIPQATVSDQVKFALLRIVKRLPKQHFKIAQESHDSFLALCRDFLIDEAAAIIKEELEQPIDFNNCTLSRDYQLVIPCDIKVGKRWIEDLKTYPDGMTKYKKAA